MGVTPDGAETALPDFDAYITKKFQDKAWGSDMEVAAAATKHKVGILVVNDRGPAQLYNRTADKTIVLKFEGKHWDWFEGTPSPDILAEAQKGTIKGVRGGATAADQEADITAHLRNEEHNRWES